MMDCTDFLVMTRALSITFNAKIFRVFLSETFHTRPKPPLPITRLKEKCCLDTDSGKGYERGEDLIWTYCSRCFPSINYKAAQEGSYLFERRRWRSTRRLKVEAV
jgi:hypothetical protein